MKNHWIQRHKSKQIKFVFELIGAFPSCSVELTPCNFGGIRLRTTDAKFGAWVKNATYKKGKTGLDGLMAVMLNGSQIECWAFLNVEVLNMGIIGASHKVQDYVYEATITCSNKTTIKSKHFQII